MAAAHSLVEAYSVLTRLPAPHRVSPATAMAQIERLIAQAAEIVPLDAAGYLALLRSAREASIAGGRIYDAVLVACAQVARARTVLTLNERHFVALVPREIAVAVPA